MAVDAETGTAQFRTNAIPVTYHECLSVVLSSLKVRILRNAAQLAAEGETGTETSAVTKAHLLESAAILRRWKARLTNTWV